MIFDKLYNIIYFLFNCCRNKKNVLNENIEQKDNAEIVFNAMHQNDLFYWHNIYQNNNSLT